MRLRRARLVSLRARMDRLLEGLEELDFLRTARAPESIRLQLAEIIADLPFEYQVLVPDRPSPTELIDHVLDVQEALRLFMTGVSADEDGVIPI